MSVIDQALKKTQSSLHKQKTDPVQIQSELTRSRSPIPPFAFQPFGLSAMVKYSLISTLSIVVIIMISFEIDSHYMTIKQRYSNFYGKMFSTLSNFSQPKKIPQKVIPVVVVQPPLILDGTLEVGMERVALINQQLYHVNEMVSGYQIKQIDYNHVLLKDIKTHKTRVLTPHLS